MNFFDRLKEEWQIKLLAFLLALVFWVYVNKIHDAKKFINFDTIENTGIPRK